MKSLVIALKTLKELWREPLLLGILAAFPVLLVCIYGIAYGDTTQGLSKYLVILVLNADAGTTLPDGSTYRAGNELVDRLKAQTWEGAPVFTVLSVNSRSEAEITLGERKAALLLHIPDGFSEALGASLPARLTLIGDIYTDNFQFSRSLLESLLREAAFSMSGKPSVSSVQYEYLPGTGTMNDFQVGIPGVVVFGLMLLVVVTAMILVREEIAHTLRRLRLTPLRSADLLVGVTLANLLLSVFLVPLTLGAAYLFGFHSQGSPILILLTGLLLCLATVGLGLLTACFARSDSEAANLGSVLGVFMALTSGAIAPMPAAPLFQVGARSIQVYDLLPTYHAAEALRRIMILGEGLPGISYHLAMLALISILILTAGILLYQRLQMDRR
ncbi:MAG TPA: ABC transporter permease [Anaerolineaceae bacterium]